MHFTAFDCLFEDPGGRIVIKLDAASIDTEFTQGLMTETNGDV